MAFNKTGTWLNGYVDALQNGGQINKRQIEFLIERLETLAKEIEGNSNDSLSLPFDLEVLHVYPDPKNLPDDGLDRDDDDLPF